MSKPIAIIGAAVDLGAQNPGVSEGPAGFRNDDIISKLTDVGLEVTDLGDVTQPALQDLPIGDSHQRYLPQVVQAATELAQKTKLAIGEGQIPVVLGGDHSLSLGSMAGASQALEGQIGVIYIDAHADLNTAKTSPTGNIHGMHLAALLGHGSSDLTSAGGPEPKLQPQNLLLVGGSDYDPAEQELIASQNIQTFNLFDFLTHGFEPLLNQIEHLSSQVTNVWVSLDLDSIDQLYAPAAAMPNAKGFSYREIVALAEFIGRKCNVVGLDLVEYNPSADQENKTAELGIELIAAILGKKYSWYTNYLKRNAV